jgi:transcriptional regulator with XRE-family HTH domain
MSTFGKKLRDCREAKGFSQSELAKFLNTNHSIIGKYERDEVKPSIDVVKNLSEVLETTVGFLLGETMQTNILKDPTMLRRLNDLVNLPEKDRECILYTLDSLLQNVKTRQAFV